MWNEHLATAACRACLLAFNRALEMPLSQGLWQRGTVI